MLFNSYPVTLIETDPLVADFLPTPAYRPFTSSSSYIASSIIPLTDSSPVSGTVLPRIFEAAALERQCADMVLASTFISKCLAFDEADPECVWASQYFDSVDSVTITVSGVDIPITQAISDLDFFYSGEWKWAQFNNQVLIYGLDLYQQISETRSDSWQYIKSPTTWSSGSVVYLEHPVTKSWIPIHPSLIRSDGLLNYYYDGVVNIRTKFPPSTLAKETITVNINGQPVEARRVDIWNSLDEKGLWIGINRNENELNSSYAHTLLVANWFDNQTLHGVRDFLSAAFRQGTLQTIPASSTTVPFPTGATGFSIRNLSKNGFMAETLTPDADSNSYRTIYSSPDLGTAFVKTVETDYTIYNSLITFNTNIDNTVDKPVMWWRLNYWTETSSSFTLTDNFPETVPDLVVYFPKNVDVKVPSTDTLLQSFRKVSPIYRWHPYITDHSVVTNSGLASFD